MNNQSINAKLSPYQNCPIKLSQIKLPNCLPKIFRKKFQANALMNAKIQNIKHASLDLYLLSIMHFLL